MNIVREHHEDLTSLIRVTVSQSDYAEAVDKTLREYKRKANVPGFRPGMVPMGIINKMYRKGVVAEQSYKLASNACFEYLEKVQCSSSSRSSTRSSSLANFLSRRTGHR